MSRSGRQVGGLTLYITCTICGDIIRLASWRPDANAVCAGCAPNVSGSIDYRLEPEAMHVPEAVYLQLLGPERSYEP